MQIKWRQHGGISPRLLSPSLPTLCSSLCMLTRGAVCKVWAKRQFHACVAAAARAPRGKTATSLRAPQTDPHCTPTLPSPPCRPCSAPSAARVPRSRPCRCTHDGKVTGCPRVVGVGVWWTWPTDTFPGRPRKPREGPRWLPDQDCSCRHQACNPTPGPAAPLCRAPATPRCAAADLETARQR